jgi:hypothetical protein
MKSKKWLLFNSLTGVSSSLSDLTEKWVQMEISF